MALFDSEGEVLIDESTMITFEKIPLSALNMASMRALSRCLNLKSETVVKFGVAVGMPADWRGLAELSGYFDLTDIRNMDIERDSTEALLNEMVTKPDATFGKLMQWIYDLGREDLIEDLKPSLERDVQNYLRRKEKKYPGPVQVAEVSDTSEETSKMETEIMTIHDEENKKAMFDAFVCSSQSPEDMAFVRKMIQVLEGTYNLQLCVSARDLVAGDSNTITAAVIHQRCRRMIIVLSPDFCDSPACDFQIKFAQTLSPGSRTKKLIPIIHKRCREIPYILKHISPLDFTKSEHVDWFWDRLGKTLSMPLTWNNKTDIAGNCDLPIGQLESSSSSDASTVNVSSDAIGPSGDVQNVQPSDWLTSSQTHPYSPEVLRDAVNLAISHGQQASGQVVEQMDSDHVDTRMTKNRAGEKVVYNRSGGSVSDSLPHEKKKMSKLKQFLKWKSAD